MTCYRTLSNIYLYYGLQEHLKIGPTGPAIGTAERQNLHGEAFFAYIGACDGQGVLWKRHTTEFLQRLFSASVWDQLASPATEQEKKNNLRRVQLHADLMAIRAEFQDRANNRPKQRTTEIVKEKQRTQGKVGEQKEKRMEEAAKKGKTKQGDKTVARPVPAVTNIEHPAEVHVPILAVSFRVEEKQANQAKKEMG